HELEGADGLVGAMRALAVVDAGHREHADEVQRRAADGRRGRDAGPDGAEGEQVDGDEGRGANPADAPLAPGGGGYLILHSLLHMIRSVSVPRLEWRYSNGRVRRSASGSSFGQ